MNENEKHPVIGLVGLVLLAAGGCGVTMSTSYLAMVTAVVGGIVLIYALVAGHVKLLG